jgi:GNAT superfamily N-acetyltransferase
LAQNISVREIACGSDEYRAALALRQAVLRTPLGLVLTPDDFENDKPDIHIGAFASNVLVASRKVAVDTARVSVSAETTGRAAAVAPEAVAPEAASGSFSLEAGSAHELSSSEPDRSAQDFEAQQAQLVGCLILKFIDRASGDRVIRDLAPSDLTRGARDANAPGFHGNADTAFEVKMRQVAVSPEVQGLGVGRAMVEFCEDLLRKRLLALARRSRTEGENGNAGARNAPDHCAVVNGATVSGATVNGATGSQNETSLSQCKITLSARDSAVSFYLKLGYAIEGDYFTEVGIPHRHMAKWMSV